jgi:hypothetical protein
MKERRAARRCCGNSFGGFVSGALKILIPQRPRK